MKYNDSIKVNSKTLIEVDHYTRIFITSKEYKMCSVRLSISFTGNNGQLGECSRIILYLDDGLICDGSLHNGTAFELKALQLFWEKFNLKPGQHTVKLLCCVNGSELFIPHYEVNYIENIVAPKLSGKKWD